jgi:hypothetical protein
MSGRRNKRRCRNCPDAQPAAVQPVQVAATQIATKLAGKKFDNNLLTRPGESDRLWNHVLFGTATCVGMIEGYVALGLPGNPHPQIVELVQRLVNVAKQIEESNANPSAPKLVPRHPSGD